jgi:hypothetical protein
MFDAALLENDDRELDPVQFERSVQRATVDLQRILATLAQRHLGKRRRAQPIANPALSWRWLLEIEEQAFSDLGFHARHDKPIIAAFLRLSDSRLPGSNIDAAVDWRRDDEHLPAVYQIVRALVEAEAGEAE